MLANFWLLQSLFGDMKVRLAGERVEQSRVEVRINGQWQVLCGDGWSLNEAQVVCKQLGLGFAENVMHLRLPEHEQFSPIFSGIKCQGNESRVSQCSVTDSSGKFCPDSYNNIAGVVCAPGIVIETGPKRVWNPSDRIGPFINRQSSRNNALILGPSELGF